MSTKKKPNQTARTSEISDLPVETVIDDLLEIPSDQLTDTHWQKIIGFFESEEQTSKE